MALKIREVLESPRIWNMALAIGCLASWIFGRSSFQEVFIFKRMERIASGKNIRRVLIFRSKRNFLLEDEEVPFSEGSFQKRIIQKQLAAIMTA